MKGVFTKNYQNFKIYFTFLLFWFSIQFEGVIQDSLAYLLVLTVGLLHGANDILILSVKEKNKKKAVQYLAYYLLIIIVCVLVYFVNAYAALLLFIIVSSYHFGEEHLSDIISKNLLFDTFYFLTYGLLIFSMIFFTSLEEVNEIMLELAGLPFTKNEIEISLIFSASFFLILSLWLLKDKKLPLKVLVEEVFYLLFLFLVFKTTSLILGFAIYFIFWHSIPSIIHQISYISNTVTNKSVTYYIKKAMPFWLISIIGLGVLFFVLPEIKIFATVVFVILFAVTVPHIWVMFKMKN
ncbi:Brp/Blh family beta-carotene 15,15'-dioxygenase [Polaribacter sp.]|uniref:Brp/Blh family beta-carotene 15,15'-dioxygenase n=1 Tax=Polaribacter sp. TaxID=1920175 RepID=UPI003F6A539A